jgi:putative ABC transport system substrate-binding protein
MKSLIWILTIFLLSNVPIANAQQTKKVYRMGHLSAGSGKGLIDDAIQGDLRERGYIEGQNLVNEWRFAEGKLDRLPGLVADLVRLKVDMLVVASTQAVLVAKEATQTIPILFAIADNPVEIGLVASLARPGGNATGLTDIAGELGGKRLEILKGPFQSSPA